MAGCIEIAIEFCDRAEKTSHIRAIHFASGLQTTGSLTVSARAVKAFPVEPCNLVGQTRENGNSKNTSLPSSHIRDQRPGPLRLPESPRERARAFLPMLMEERKFRNPSQHRSSTPRAIISIEYAYAIIVS
jgi:hypothetical protein